MEVETITKRKEMLDVWINEVLMLCPGNADIHAGD